MEWQPIETAPKDGTPILVCCNDGILQRKGYCHMAVVFWCIKDTDYRQWEKTIGGGGLYSEPTHWMPLPNPPSPICS